jgi:methanogenic corrinoid protein MtbC1
MLGAAGFDVVDLGVDVAAVRICEAFSAQRPPAGKAKGR